MVLDIVPPRGFKLFPQRVNMMNTLAHVTVLTVTSTLLEGLSARFDDNEYREMEFCLFKLKEFHLIVSEESFVNPLDVVQFLRKCPFVQSVFIDLGLNSFQNSLYWDFQGRQIIEDWQCLFPFIKHVKIKGFTWNELPITMSRFFLRHAITLELLVLVKAKIYVDPQILTPNLIKSGISTDAKIEIHEYMEDVSDIIPTHLIDV
ncbi:hypothetical protein ACJIZ3_006492 [Penstemon smallii]|uniref:FBD domain-containing protein n=1 Tax=Penstemon smallii TaxID=265156 RepID=A0ABD3S7Z2_9LAMI